MKKILFLFAVVLTALQMSAGDVSMSRAQAAADSFLKKQVASGTLRASAASNLKLVKAEASVARPAAVDYYIFNSEKSYVVVSGDDQAPEILMYGIEGPLDLDNIPDGMQWLLNKYKYQIDGLKAGTMVPVDLPMINATAVPPMVTANWDQSSPYNNQCPTSGGSRAVTGCPATSLAMCYYKWKWPETFPACAAINGNTTGGYSASALSERAADWDNIIDEYTGPSNYSSTSAQKTAVAWLMRYAGQCIPDYYYSSDASGADDPEIYQGVLNMGYTDAQYLKLTDLVSSGWSGYTNSTQYYTDAQWNQFMMNELLNGRPIEYLAYDVSYGQVSGHAFNVFGCNSSGQYYVNWGWSGDSNGYCTLHNFTTSTGATGQSGSYVFKYGEAMIIGIAPPGGAANNPTLTVNPTSLSFTGCTSGQTYTKTFTVTGANLTGNVTISSSNGKFTVSPSTLTATQAQNGATITVTFAPTAAGTQSGTITVASSGATSKTVEVSGTATAPAGTLTVNPTSLSFTDCSVGQSYTKTFTVTGTNLTGNVNLTSSNNKFTVSPSSLTAAQAQAGATVTVTYTPTAAGTQSGTITVSSTGVTSKTVSVTGTATATPTITVNPTSVNLATVVGTPVTQTIMLQGYNLTSGVKIAVSGTGFSVNKTNVTKTYATNGTDFIVTYNPTTAGTHTGTVTLTSTGAETVTIPLNGTATEPVRTITATPTTLNFNALVGETVTKTFTVNGENLNGALSLAINNGNGIYSITPATISVEEATAGKTVTVTYAPTAFGVTNASVTISGGGASAVTVTLNGQADLVKYAPVMLPADENYINLTQFRADWTDETPAANVASYTLEVSAKVVEPEPVVELLSSVAGTDFTGSANGYYDITLPDPWGGTNVRGGLNTIIYFRNNYNNTGTAGNITYTVPAGYENATFTMKITTAATSDGTGNLTVATPQTTAVNHHFTAGETYAWVVSASSGEKITITTPDANYSPDIALMEVYTGDATASMLRANEEGNTTYRLITGITDKFYTVETLAPEGTYLYKVKALYLDGTESEWSNIEEVTLFQNSLLGDVNRDGSVTIADVTDLVDYILGLNDDIDLVAADLNGDNNVTIADVTDLIDLILGEDTAQLRMSRIHSNGR